MPILEDQVRKAVRDNLPDVTPIYKSDVDNIVRAVMMAIPVNATVEVQLQTIDDETVIRIVSYGPCGMCVSQINGGSRASLATGNTLTLSVPCDKVSIVSME